jgi:hypothetical protein
MMLMAGSVKISCHTVIKQFGEDQDISEVFVDIDFPSSLLRTRANVLVATVPALATALQLHIRARGISSPIIASILNGSHPELANITVATTGTVNFAEPSYKHYNNGFRKVGNFLSFQDRDAVIVPTEDFAPASDVPASIGATAGEGVDFFHVWGPMGARPDTHFILIYLVEVPLVRYFGNLVVPDWDDTGILTPGVLGFGSGMEDLLPAPSSPLTLHRALSASSLMPSSSPTRSVSSTQSSHRSFSPYPAPNCSPADPGPAVEVCRSKISDFDSLHEKAKFIGGNRTTPFISLARRFYAMEKILQELSFSSEIPDQDYLDTSQEFYLEGGTPITLTVRQLVGIHKWDPSTFLKKRINYSSAVAIAKQSWKDPIPGICMYYLFSVVLT